MKIIDERKIEEVPINEINEGDCFLDMNNDLMMKIWDDIALKAVSLTDGHIYRFDLNTKVIPVKAKVIIYE